MITPGLYRAYDPLASFGLTVDNDGVVVDVVAPFKTATKSPAAAAGIVPGDRVNLWEMRCIPIRTPQCQSLVAVLGGLGGMQSVMPGRQITLVMAPASAGPARIVNLVAAPAPLSWAGRVVLLADTIVGILVIVIVFRLVWSRPNRMTWGLFLFVIWFNPGQSFAYYAFLQRWPIAIFIQEIFEAAATGAAFVGFVSFALRFPNDRVEPRWRPLERALPLLGLAMTSLTLLSFATGIGFRTEAITQASFLAGYVINGAVLLILLERRRRLPPQEYQRMRWVIWGCAIGIPAYILAEIAQSVALLHHSLGISLSQTAIGLLYLPNGVLAYFVAEAVRQSRVISVSIPLRHGTILTGLSLATGVPIVYLHEKLSHFEHVLQPPEWIWPLVVAPVALLFLHKLHERAVELADRVFNIRFHRRRRRLNEVGQAILNAESIEELDRLLVTWAVDALGVASSALFFRRSGVFRRSEYAVGWDKATTRELNLESDAVVLRVLETRKPSRLSQKEWHRPGLPAGVALPCLSVPITSEALDVAAVLLIGAHENGNDIDRDEREMLYQLAAKAATGFERVITNLLRNEVIQLRAQLLAEGRAAGFGDRPV